MSTRKVAIFALTVAIEIGYVGVIFGGLVWACGWNPMTPFFALLCAACLAAAIWLAYDTIFPTQEDNTK